MATQLQSTTIQSECVGIFDDIDRGRIGNMTSDEGMARLSEALEFVNVRSASVDTAYFNARARANSLIEDYQIRIANLAIDATLSEGERRDMDLRDDIRWQVRPYIGRGLRFGRKIALELLNG